MQKTTSLQNLSEKWESARHTRDEIEVAHSRLSELLMVGAKLHMRMCKEG